MANIVKHPSHYNQGDIECWDAMVAAFGEEAVMIFGLLNAFKYVWRQDGKDGIRDIKKAITYLEKYEELYKSINVDKNKENKIIYVSHPYGGNEENKNNIEKVVISMRKRFPKYTFVSPVHCFGYLYNDTNYEEGLDMCLKLMDICDEVWVFGDYKESKGCVAEIETAKNKDMPVKIYVEGGECLYGSYTVFNELS